MRRTYPRAWRVEFIQTQNSTYSYFHHHALFLRHYYYKNTQLVRAAAVQNLFNKFAQILFRCENEYGKYWPKIK